MYTDSAVALQLYCSLFPMIIFILYMKRVLRNIWLHILPIRRNILIISTGTQVLISSYNLCSHPAHLHVYEPRVIIQPKRICIITKYATMKHIMLHHSDHKGKCYDIHYGHPVLEENDQASSKRRKWDCTICRLSLTPRGRPTGSTQRDVPRLTFPFTHVKQKRQDKAMRYYKCICRCHFIFRLHRS